MVDSDTDEEDNKGDDEQGLCSPRREEDNPEVNRLLLRDEDPHALGGEDIEPNTEVGVMPDIMIDNAVGNREADQFLVDHAAPDQAAVAGAAGGNGGEAPDEEHLNMLGDMSDIMMIVNAGSMADQLLEDDEDPQAAVDGGDNGGEVPDDDEEDLQAVVDGAGNGQAAPDHDTSRLAQGFLNVAVHHAQIRGRNPRPSIEAILYGIQHHRLAPNTDPKQLEFDGGGVYTPDGKRSNQSRIGKKYDTSKDIEQENDVEKAAKRRKGEDDDDDKKGGEGGGGSGGGMGTGPVPV